MLRQHISFIQVNAHCTGITVLLVISNFYWMGSVQQQNQHILASVLEAKALLSNKVQHLLNHMQCKTCMSMNTG